MLHPGRFSMFAIIVLCTLVARTAAAQAPVSSLDDLKRLVPPGTLVTVQDSNGKRTTGTLRDLTDAGLVLQGRGAFPEAKLFSPGEVAEVTKADSRANGYWIGFAAGAVPGVILGSMLNQYCYNESPSHCPAAIVVLGGLTALAGGGIGWAIDSAIDGPVLYSRAPARAKTAIMPFYAPANNGTGLALSLAF